MPTSSPEQCYRSLGGKTGSVDNSSISRAPAASPSHSTGLRFSSKVDRWKAVCIALYTIQCITFGLAANSVGPTTTYLSRLVHCQEEDLGTVFLVTGLTYLVGGFPAGWLIDRMPAHVILGVCSFFQGLALVMVPYSTSISHICLFFGISTFLQQGINTTCNAATTWLFRNSSPWLNMLGAGYGLGSLFCPLLVSWCKHALGGTEWVFCIIAAMCCILSLPCLLVPSPPSCPTAPQPAPSCETTCTINTAIAMDTNANDRATASIRRRFLGSAMLLVFMNPGTQTAVSAWIYTYAVRFHHISADAARTVMSAFWASSTLASLAVACTATFIPLDVLLWLTFPLGVVGCLFGLLIPPAAVWTTALLTAAVVLYGIGSAPGYANLVALTAEYVHVDGSVAVQFSVMSALGSALLPPLVPVLVNGTPIHFQSFMWMAFLSSLLQLPLLAYTLYTAQGLQRRELLRCVVCGDEGMPGTGGIVTQPDFLNGNDCSAVCAPSVGIHTVYGPNGAWQEPSDDDNDTDPGRDVSEEHGMVGSGAHNSGQWNLYHCAKCWEAHTASQQQPLAASQHMLAGSHYIQAGSQYVQAGAQHVFPGPQYHQGNSQQFPGASQPAPPRPVKPGSSHMVLPVSTGPQQTHGARRAAGAAGGSGDELSVPLLAPNGRPSCDFEISAGVLDDLDPFGDEGLEHAREGRSWQEQGMLRNSAVVEFLSRVSYDGSIGCESPAGPPPGT